MAGFLDKNDRIIDMVLTGYGRSLLARGGLKFVSWVPMDDEVDYSPFVSNSGSLTDIQLSASINEQIEACPIREATTGYRTLNKRCVDSTNGDDVVFTIAQGQTHVPRLMTSSIPSSIDVNIDQRKISEIQTHKDSSGKTVETIGPIDRGFQRSNSTSTDVSTLFEAGSFPAEHQLAGFLVRVFISGSDGLTEVDPKIDTQGRVVYNGELVLRNG